MTNEFSDEFAEVEDWTLYLKRYASVVALDQYGMMISPDRFALETWTDEAGRQLIKAILDVATKTDLLHSEPAGLWDYFLDRHCPRWFKRMFGRWLKIKYNDILVEHKFPELRIPSGYLGREYVHLRVIERKENVE